MCLDGALPASLVPPGGVVCSLHDHGRGLSTLEVARLFEYATEPGPLPTDLDGRTVHGLDRIGARFTLVSGRGSGTVVTLVVPGHIAA